MQSNNDGRMHRWAFERRLLFAFSLIWIALAIGPVSRADWLLENLLVFISVPMLIATRHRFRFSHAAYVCLFIFYVLHVIGAHYTYSLVPYDRWAASISGHTVSELLGWDRNHYDRLVHFLYGVLLLLPAVEIFDRYAPARGWWQWLMPVCFIMSHSVIFELVEWLAVLVVAPELGEAYLGTQGDGWDAQKDMALATLGAVLSMIVVQLKRRRAAAFAIRGYQPSAVVPTNEASGS